MIKTKSDITKKKMSKARKRWYKKNPEKAKLKARKVSETKKKQGKWKGQDNPNYGSKKFIGESYKGKPWNKGLNKNTHPSLKKLSEENLGEKNPYWKGDQVGKSSLHNWIRKRKPKPKLCEDCKKVPPYDLSNISGKYKRDVNDFKWVCRKCHMISDGRLEKFRKHEKGGKKQMGKKILLKTEIPREKGFLYFCGTDNKGNITVCQAEMARGKKKSKSKKKPTKK